MAETLTLHLSTGDVVIKLRPDLAPNHVDRIVELASEGFYDGVKFHRVIDGFMAQGGCPDGTGMGGSKKPNLKQEFSAEPHTRGACSMARTQDPNSANSQFFIVFDDATFLDRQYTVWGNVIEGMENVDALPKGEPPREPGMIQSVTVAGISYSPNPFRVERSRDTPEQRLTEGHLDYARCERLIEYLVVDLWQF
ncbi:MAG: peptidylprolyl isomerase [Sphingomonadales bacterium]|nr:peptidylprolyl isomerase [Sphingomonadales bacterium]